MTEQNQEPDEMSEDDLSSVAGGMAHKPHLLPHHDGGHHLPPPIHHDPTKPGHHHPGHLPGHHPHKP